MLVTAFYFLTGPVFIKNGYPPLMSLLMAVLVVLIPVELFILFYEGWKSNQRISLKSVVLFQEKVPAWQFVLLVLGLVIWSMFIFVAFKKVDNLFVQNLLSWFPSWALPANSLGNPGQYSKAALALTLFAGLILSGIAAPIVEELYFRGYLLPRIPSSRWWAPLINVLLFSVYHFFSPWQNVTRILALLPLVYVVAWKRNIYIGMWAHCILNTLAILPSFVFLFS
jgi:hypothetical protein